MPGIIRTFQHVPISCILKLPLQIKSQIHPSQIQSPQQKTDFNFIVLNKFGNLNWSWRANFNHRASFCFTDRLSPTLQLWSLTWNSRLSRSWGGHWGRTQMNWEEELQSVANQRHSHELFSKGFFFFFFCHLENCRSLTMKWPWTHSYPLAAVAAVHPTWWSSTWMPSYKEKAVVLMAYLFH